MTREEAIRLIGWLKCTTNREDDLEAIDMAIDALNNSIQMSNIQELQAENGFLKEMVKFYREQQTEVVRCKDCKWYEPAHILHADGSKTYVDEDAPWVTADVGINCGGQCIHHCGLKIYCTAHNREDPDDYENIVIFRKPNEYCCFGERREP